MIDEEEKEFDKKEAQVLSFQLVSLIRVLQKYCCYYYDYENMDSVILALKYIYKLADRLYCALDSCDVFDEVLLKGNRQLW